MRPLSPPRQPGARARPRDAAAVPSDFQELVTRLPGVDATGQNGLLETFSIRGNGGNGFLALVGTPDNEDAGTHNVAPTLTEA